MYEPLTMSCVIVWGGACTVDAVTYTCAFNTYVSQLVDVMLDYELLVPDVLSLVLRCYI